MTAIGKPDPAAGQRVASDPRLSAWVSANAGCGKTTVLANRVLRLLLDGVPPGRLLCLTFTKAAAAEMANRVLTQLADWTRQSDEELAASIARIEGAVPGEARRAQARRLFAAALETPGGLKVQTIHAFCEALLHRFPIEANIAGHFEVLDELSGGSLLADARRRVLARAATDGDGRLGIALGRMLLAAPDQAIEAVLNDVVRLRDAFRDWVRIGASVEEALAAVARELGATGLTRAEVLASLWPSPHFPVSYLEELLTALDASSTNDQKAAEAIRAALACSDDDRLDLWCEVFFTQGKRRKIAGRFTKAICGRFADLETLFEREMDRLEAMRDRIATVMMLEATAGLATLADAIIAEYEALKTAHGVLDFDDLVTRTATLLTRSGVAAWVLYKLDGGIDHILVDEAQDTNPRQWQIVRALAEEFFSGEGARSISRTLFAVGDEKQSIYSFQGARPAAFDEERRHHLGRATEARRAFKTVPLTLSFRSTADVLAAVDAVFAREAAVKGVVASPADYAAHQAHRPGRGFVELWPCIVAEKPTVPEAWHEPMDRLGPASPPIQAANRIADTIAGMIGRERLDRDRDAVVRPGHILILVRKRDAFVDAMNRALKQRGIPVAGQDRLTLTEHIAVQDLMALGHFVLLPEDDLNLAALLRSPLIGLGEVDLYALAQPRGARSLWSALWHARETPPFAAAHARLSAWRDRADFDRPHEFYARVLGPEGGRRAFVERLGVEALDVLDEFLTLTLTHERAAVPSLQTFLAALAAAPPDIKRESESGRNEVRVMTVHGAKGLEAPVVFLVDSGSQVVHPGHLPKVVPYPCGSGPTALLWVASKQHRPACLERELDRIKEEQAAEYRRLLYVGMTRAADRLYVVGFRNAKNEIEGCWHKLVREALQTNPNTQTLRDPTTGEVRAWRFALPHPARSSVLGEAARSPADPSPRLPDWLGRAPPAEPGLRRLSPSAAGALFSGAAGTTPFRKAREVFATDADRRRGELVHALLQALPDCAPDERPQVAEAFLARRAADLPAGFRAALALECLAVLADPDLAPAFGAGSRAEVPLVGDVATAAGIVRVAGQVDRLAVLDDAVMLVDYKTNRAVPKGAADAPREHVAQMALYRALLRELFPGRTVRAVLVYTAGPRLVALREADLDAALGAAGGRLSAPRS